MFSTNKATLLAGLRRLHAMRCDYCSNPAEVTTARCDCKYGFGFADRPDERNGCPELRMATFMLEALTPIEWDDLLKRAGYLYAHRSD